MCVVKIARIHTLDIDILEFITCWKGIDMDPLDIRTLVVDDCPDNKYSGMVTLENAIMVFEILDNESLASSKNEFVLTAIWLIGLEVDIIFNKLSRRVSVDSLFESPEVGKLPIKIDDDRPLHKDR